MRRRDAKNLVGDAWLHSDYRIKWETRVMRRRVPLYKAGIGVLRALNRLSPGPRPSLGVFATERAAPGGAKTRFAKLRTMTGDETASPVTGPELYERTSFASRLARTISADEWPQVIEEYERRKAGAAPRYHYVGHRPLNDASHALMDKAWAKGEIPTEQYRVWLSEVKNKDHGALYSKFFTHGGARIFPGAEANPDFRKARVTFDVAWKSEASLAREKEVLRRARVLRARQLIVFAKQELAHATGARSASTPASAPAAPTPARVDPYTPEVVAAVSEFVKPIERRGATARRAPAPKAVASSAVDVAVRATQGVLPVAVPTRAAPGSAAHPEPSAHAAASVAPAFARTRRNPTRTPAPGHRLAAGKRR
ncbi:hypothetical protein LO772_09140 [Yinghuangia sp. ASG 101]|uniref:hypothetical protein n=1 Tax=Yinghuangia sp. ASG 101 TaxID=2896848 RepID=UPI001E327690|nr:hypothetical protein [Yinghuangia sp. ASG 101]UGQ13741.1 hypothetical protein LO772_09140 [Yinghuangia sp. ASG 101]